MALCSLDDLPFPPPGAKFPLNLCLLVQRDLLNSLLSRIGGGAGKCGVMAHPSSKIIIHENHSEAAPTLNATRRKQDQAAKIRELRRLLLAEGLCSVGRQASALGLSRSTTWALLKADHKQSGVSVIILKRMLGAPDLPNCARQWIEQYVHERLAGAYGHSLKRRRLFREQLGLSGPGTTDGSLGNVA